MKYTGQTLPKHFRRYGCVLATSACLSLVLFFGLRIARAEDESPAGVKPNGTNLMHKSEELAKSLIRKLSEIPVGNATSLSLLYDVHMDVGWSVKMKMDAALEMRKDQSSYIATFSLSEPTGENLWSKFALSIFGKHTLQYKEMMQSVETRLEEKLRLKNGRFLTEEFREILSAAKSYKNQSGIRVYFDHTDRLVKFWEDQTEAEFSKSIKYTDQVGPMTGFFNFLFFENPRTDLTIINALKRVEDVEAGGVFSRREKKVDFVFGSELVRLHPNNTGRHMEYANAISFRTDNFLDIIHGKNIYFNLLHSDTHNLKIPYAIQLDGIISKTKKRKRELKIIQLMKRKPDSRAYEEELEAIQAMDDLAAKDVVVLLRGFKVDHK
jgi:hypothetical protein